MSPIIVGRLLIEIHLGSTHSLKQKRSIIKSIKARITSKYNVSIAEVDHLDKWQRAALAIVKVSNEAVPIEKELTAIAQFIDTALLGEGYITQRHLEFI